MVRVADVVGSGRQADAAEGRQLEDYGDADAGSSRDEGDERGPGTQSSGVSIRGASGCGWRRRRVVSRCLGMVDELQVVGLVA